MGVKPRERKATAIKTGARFSIHNVRALISELKEKGQIAQELNFNEKELLVIINDGMANIDMASQEAKQLVINILPDLCDNEAGSDSESETVTPDEAATQTVFLCSRLTIEDIQGMILSLQQTERVRSDINVDAELLQSFILFELEKENINNPQTQRRIIDYINSQDIFDE